MPNLKMYRMCLAKSPRVKTAIRGMCAAVVEKQKGENLFIYSKTQKEDLGTFFSPSFFLSEIESVDTSFASL